MPRRIPRWLARLPIPLFRLGLGPLLGGRLMVLEHRGRRSGEPRLVALEVLAREPGALYLVSGYGRRSQWFRNVLADPAVRVWTGALRGEPGRAEVLPADVARARLQHYRDTHPAAARALGRALDLPALADPAPLPADIADRLPIVRIAPR